MPRKRKTAKAAPVPGAQEPVASSASGSGPQAQASPVQQPAATAARNPEAQSQPPVHPPQQSAASSARDLEPQTQTPLVPQSQQVQQLAAPSARNLGPRAHTRPPAPSQQLQQRAASSARNPVSQIQPLPAPLPQQAAPSPGRNSGPQVQPSPLPETQQPVASSASNSGPQVQSSRPVPPQNPAASSASYSPPEFVPPVFCCSSIEPTIPFTTAKDTKDRSAEFHKGLEEFNKENEDKLKEDPNPYSAEEIHGIQGNLIYCKWDLVNNKKVVEHHLRTHPDHEPDFKDFLRWAWTGIPEKSIEDTHKQIFQVTEDLTNHSDKKEPKMRNLTLRTRLYAPLANVNGYCELLSGLDRQTLKPKKIQIGNTLDCKVHKKRYFICLYAKDPPSKFGGRDDKAIIQFEGGAGMHHDGVRIWLARIGWLKGGLEGSSFQQVDSINCIRAGVRRSLGV